MKQRAIIILGLLVLTALGGWLYFRRGSHDKSFKPGLVALPTAAPMSPFSPTPKRVPVTPVGTYEPWHGGQSKDLSDPRWNVVHEREKIDPKWEGKMPIEFYGKVLDEREQPIAGATVEFRWTDLSDAGSTQRVTKSDSSGLFSLSGVRGKFLGVEVKKEGYYVAPGNRYGYEYAGFWDKAFFEPDPNSPVIFHLRKKGEAEPLIFGKEKLNVSVNSNAEIRIDQQTKLTVQLLVNEQIPAKQWSVRLSINPGGLQSTTDGFQFEAPATGYQPFLVVNYGAPKPTTWVDGYEGGTFYFKTMQNFGRLELEMIPGKTTMRVKYWLNPKAGSRNLEYDPAKQIDPQ